MNNYALTYLFTKVPMMQSLLIIALFGASSVTNAEETNNLNTSKLSQHKHQQSLAATTPALSYNLNNTSTQQLSNTKLFQTISVDHDQIYGSVDAAVSIISYMDFSCPYCRKLRPTLKKLINESNGHINWVFRHFPLTENPTGSILESQAAECASHIAGNHQFWTFADRLLSLSRRSASNSETLIKRAAYLASIDYGQLLECINSKHVTDKIQRNKKEALNLGINATPTLLLYHHSLKKLRIVSGAISFEKLQKEIEVLLEGTSD